MFNLVADPDFLLVAWERVRSNTGARTAGIDGLIARRIEAVGFVPAMLAGLRDQFVTMSLARKERRSPMAIVAHTHSFVIGVDTHALGHALAILALPTGEVIDHDQFPPLLPAWGGRSPGSVVAPAAILMRCG